jgi:D-alanine--poly(phosphoribitol) ligase subunit 1
MITGKSLWGGLAECPCLLESFARTSRHRAEAVAVVDGKYNITYAQLISWIRRISLMLAESGIRGGDRVAVAGPRSAAVIAAMWATVGAGAAYVPLDSQYPAKRLAHMLADSGASLLLYAGADPDFGHDVPRQRIPEVDVSLADAEGNWPCVKCDPEEPVYIIYTSGSTGLPKGVALPHRCIDNMAQWQASHSVRPDLRTAQFAPLNFDVWFQEVLGTLCGGGTLVVMPEPLRRDPIAFLDWLAAENVERLFLPCVALHMLTVAAAERASLADLALLEINTAGEQLVCTPPVRDFFRRVEKCRLNNHYGQSESAMVTVHTLTGPSTSWPTLPPIGRPLPGCEILIDATDPGDPQTGELLVAGLPLSVGYLNQPQLNLERYVTVPRTANGHTRAFRTGDLVQVSDGLIQFLTRVDHELKIRGFRVNPVEVDALLVEQPGITEAVTVAIEIAGGSRYLCSAVTVADGYTFDAAQTVATLSDLLPAHSLPRSITPLTELPRTPSGKVDRDEVTRQLAQRPAPTARS